MRVANLNGSEHCVYCCDNAQVVHGTSPGLAGEPMEQMAPCPNCERGFSLEFADEDEGGKKRRPPWGLDGYWRGRNWRLELVPICEHSTPQREYERQATTAMEAVRDKVSPEAFSLVERMMQASFRGRPPEQQELTRPL